MLASFVSYAEPLDGRLPALALGDPKAKQLAVSQELVPGLTHYQVNILSNYNNLALSSGVLNEQDASQQAHRIRAIDLCQHKILNCADIKVGVSEILGPLEKHQRIGYRVFVEGFQNQDEAMKVSGLLAQVGLTYQITDMTTLHGYPGNFEISILKLEPGQYKGAVTLSLAHEHIREREKTSEIANRTGATAAINGGFFAYKAEQGVPGDPAGITVLNGMIVSEAVIGRPALLIRNKPSLTFEVLNNVSNRLQLVIGESSFAVKGVNRHHGLIMSCGYVEDKAAIPAQHDAVCHEENDLVIYDHHFGPLSPELTQDKFTFGIDKEGKVYFSPDIINKDQVPLGHHIVVATGNQMSAVKKAFSHTSKAKLEKSVWARATRLNLRRGDYIVNGGPTLLLDNNRQQQHWPIQGWDPLLSGVGIDAFDERDNLEKSLGQKKRQIAFYDNWVNRRHPRTAVGVDKAGILYAVVIYGRDPQRSVGASVAEMADIMQSLGVQDAVNLDGGGSSVMMVKGEKTGKPSDNTGERKVADALVFHLDPEK